MSVWKKAAKANQKTHRERHQPDERKHLGLLEKKKDYKKRATDYNEKQQTLKLLRKRALNKNPDEFYHHMINSKTEGGLHFEKEKQQEETPEQLQLIRTQDLKYITTKRTQELKKIERLQAELHLSSVNFKVQNKHIRFASTAEQNTGYETLGNFDMQEVDVKKLGQAAEKHKKAYIELAKRINREKELSVIQQKVELNRHLESKKSLIPPKKIKKGSKDAPPVYLWKYERKK